MLSMFRQVLSNLTHRPATRVQRRDPFANARGHLEIEIEKCSFCGMCQRRCPAEALAVDRTAKDWRLDPLSCVICGLCVDACPKKCLHLCNTWRVSTTRHSAETSHQEPRPDQRIAN